MHTVWASAIMILVAVTVPGPRQREKGSMDSSDLDGWDQNEYSSWETQPTQKEPATGRGMVVTVRLASVAALVRVKLTPVANHKNSCSLTTALIANMERNK